MGTVHIRKKAAKTPFGMSGPRYMRHCDLMASGAIRDPQRETLCGAPIEMDMTWAETRYPKNRAYVTCPACVAERTADPKALL